VLVFTSSISHYIYCCLSTSKTTSVETRHWFPIKSNQGTIQNIHVVNYFSDEVEKNVKYTGMGMPMEPVSNYHLKMMGEKDVAAAETNCMSIQRKWILQNGIRQEWA